MVSDNSDVCSVNSYKNQSPASRKCITDSGLNKEIHTEYLGLSSEESQEIDAIFANKKLMEFLTSY